MYHVATSSPNLLSPVCVSQAGTSNLDTDGSRLLTMEEVEVSLLFSRSPPKCLRSLQIILEILRPLYPSPRMHRSVRVHSTSSCACPPWARSTAWWPRIRGTARPWATRPASSCRPSKSSTSTPCRWDQGPYALMLRPHYDYG